MKIYNISQRGRLNILGFYRFEIKGGKNTGRDPDYWVNFYLGFIYEEQ